MRVGEPGGLLRRRPPTVSSRKGTASTRKPSRPSCSQKPMTLAISSRTRGFGDVEVGLLLVEAVQVPLPRLLRQRPDARLLVGEDDLLLRVRRRVGAPDVEVAERRVDAALGRPEPRVLDRGVVDDEVDDHPHAAVLRRPDDLDEVAVGAQPRVDAVEVGDVVAVVAVAGRIEGHQPQAGDAEVGEVVDPLGEPDEVAAAVAVPVHEGLDVQAVDDGVLPPQVGRVGDPHPPCLPARALSSRASMSRQPNGLRGHASAPWSLLASSRLRADRCAQAGISAAKMSVPLGHRGAAVDGQLHAEPDQRVPVTPSIARTVDGGAAGGPAPRPA